jgi:hypothetical protein
MRVLLNCLTDWLIANRADGSAYSLFVALATETLKRAASEDPAQREFDAEALASAAGGPSDFDSAKRWIDRAKFEVYVGARQMAIEQHFRAAGHSQALKVVRRSPAGRHRAVWFLEPYELVEPADDPGLVSQSETTAAMKSPLWIEYDFTPPGGVKAVWYARPLLGSGSFITRSWRGLLWVAVFLIPVLYLLVSIIVALSYTYLRRPLLTSDIASLVLLVALGWVVWRNSVRPALWLVEDRIALATELWVGWNEETAQLELARDENKRRRLQLVRYSAVCPICAGTVELRYSQGPNRRRLLGCCDEAPQEHVFSFDRVLRTGRRLASDSRNPPF